LKKGRVITVFGCGGDRDATKRPIMGEIAQRLSDIAILTSDNPRTENPHLIIEDVKKGMNGDHYLVEEDREQAIVKAIEIAQKNDIILIAGKGHETYQILGRKKIHFDDREIARREIVKRKIRG
jgi:UDP-N-acetylmuramoyl-L-alanyl-D-glutamate--2,6-diaminopimelate ligase